MPAATDAQGEGETGKQSRDWPGPCAGVAYGMEKVRTGTGRETGLGHAGSDLSQSHVIITSDGYWWVVNEVEGRAGPCAALNSL